MWHWLCQCFAEKAGVPLALPVRNRTRYATGSASAWERTGTPHRKRIRHYHEPGHLHELTFSCYERQPLLTNNAWLPKLSECIDDAGSETAIELVAFVFMPEHIHLLMNPTYPEPDIGFYLARIKQPVLLADQSGTDGL